MNWSTVWLLDTIIPVMSQRGEHIDEPGYPGENIQKDVEKPQFP